MLSLASNMEERLLQAAETGDASTIRKLVKNFVNVNIKDGIGVPALSRAVKGGHFDVTKALVDAQVDVSAMDTIAVTPLHIAATKNYTEIVKLLVLNGAKLDQKNREGYRPIDLAHYESEAWDILHEAERGCLPEVEEVSEVPYIPDYSLSQGGAKKKKGKKKGKKGKGKGKKKGGKKKKK